MSDFLPTAETAGATSTVEPVASPAEGGFVAAEPTWMPRERIEELGEQVATIVGYEPGGRIFAAVEMLGGIVERQNAAIASNTGSLEVHPGKTFTINLSPFSAGTRSRFTIAHEIGHFVLHSQFGERRIRIERSGTGRVEWEANWFAAGFLMPKSEFEKKSAEGWGDAQLAEYFGVSEAAIEVRRRFLKN